MGGIAHFLVDSKLASVLGENYRSTEQALKELVDNAWDADADHVWIELPELLSGQPIVIRDDGSGMTERELRGEYLNIANGRKIRKGEETPLKHRSVKGRKGIGKFAGLVAADSMIIETKSRGIITRLIIKKKDLLNSSTDIEKVDLPLATQKCDSLEHGTTITLTELKQRRSLPTAASLKQLLVLEYGREHDFTIYVDNELLTMEDIQGSSHFYEVNLPDIGSVKLTYKIADAGKAISNPGICLRVGDKIVGTPNFFGLENCEDIPSRLRRRIYGEIEAPGLEADVTADGASVLENSIALQQVQKIVQSTVGEQIEKVYANDIKLAKAHLKPVIDKRLEQIPANKRELARAALDRAMRKFYGESPDRIHTLIDVVLDAFEKDEYWQVCQKIQETRHGDIVALAEALDTFGFIQMAAMANQAQVRIGVLDTIGDLISNPNTLERDIHKALERNLWIFGPAYSLMSSDKALDKFIEEFLECKYSGTRAKKRPDLLLSRNMPDNILLVEFKRPSHTLTRADEAQAVSYRDDIQPYFPDARIDVLLVGNKRDPTSVARYDNSDTKYTSYTAVLSMARAQLTWLLQELTINRCQI